MKNTFVVFLSKIWFNNALKRKVQNDKNDAYLRKNLSWRRSLDSLENYKGRFRERKRVPIPT